MQSCSMRANPEQVESEASNCPRFAQLSSQDAKLTLVPTEIDRQAHTHLSQTDETLNFRYER